jgi:predicted NBD/HSP70 family sugar kinase
MVSVLNPEVLVLGGYFAVLGKWLLEPMQHELTSSVTASKSRGYRVELSTLGLTAAARGGAQLVLESVIADPMVVPTRTASAAVALGDPA